MVDAHRGAFEYDWRYRFGKPLSIVGTAEMTWGEAVRLTRILTLDTSSQVFAASAGWEFPVSREWIVAADHRDSTEFNRVGKKAKAYPRPWPDTSVTRRGAAMGVDAFRAVVAAAQARQREIDEAATTGQPSDPEGSA